MRLHVLVLLCAFCTIAAAGPTVKVATDRFDEGATVFGGYWADLMVKVDPGKDPVALDGLQVAPTSSSLEVQFKKAILPPPDGDGFYEKPFEARIPMLPVDAEFRVDVTVAGKGKSGDLFSVTGEATVYADAGANKRNHLTGTATLEKKAVKGEANAIVLKLTVIDGYHVYGEKVEIGIPMLAALLPAGPEKAWETRAAPHSPPGENYYGEFTLEIPFVPTRVGRVEARVGLMWQACTELICDQNELAYLPVAFDVAEGSGSMDVIPVEPPTEEGDDIAGQGLWTLILLSIGAGLFALAMPCTYPLIPITISFFTKQAETSHGRVLPLALAYGGGIVAIFAGIGLLVGATTLSGENVLQVATNPWVNGVFALLFLVFGLSLIGLFEIRLPSSFDNVAARATGSGGFLSVFAMGTTLVITSFTCTAPFIGTLLVYASQSGDWRTVTMSMGVFGLTMAIPFVFLSLSPKAIQNMPKSGIWMKHLKVTLGIIELGLVLKFVSNIDLHVETYFIGRELFLVLWGLSFLAASLYLFGVFDLLRRGASWGITRGRATAATLLLVITAYLAGGLGGAPRRVANVEAFLPVIETRYDRNFLAVVKEDYEEGIRKAQAKGALVFLHFTGFQ